MEIQYKQQSKSYSGSVTAKEILDAFDIKSRQDVVAISIDGEIFDLTYDIRNSCRVNCVYSFDDAGTQIIRDNCANILANAISNLYTDSKLACVNYTDKGFCYDILFSPHIQLEDLAKIEKEMLEIINTNTQSKKRLLAKPDAIKLLEQKKQKYKAHIIKESNKKEHYFYTSDKCIDISTTPVSVDPQHLRHFKLLSLSGVYWLGDSTKENMQRIYIASFADKKSLSKYLKEKEEAELRDHRRLGNSLQLFHFQEEAQGMVFWHERGFKILHTLQKYIRKKQIEFKYKEVQTPLLCSDVLWQKSGHIDQFAENMFFIKEENKNLALKPMNCPCHIEIFKKHQVSYKDLPLRLAEFGRCHRNESSGSLHGLMRVKSFLQDDAHIFCTKEQILEEYLSFFNMVSEIYNDLGFEKVSIKLATRPENYMGDKQMWEEAETTLENAIKQTKVKYEILEGEGAFYGPKVEFHFKDTLERNWQCGTIQIDFISAENLGAYYIDSKNQKQYPVILHRAALGTFERFIGIMLEHYNGRLPIWLSHIQVAVLPITSDCIDYAKEVYNKLYSAGINVEIDLESSTIGNKIKYWSEQKASLMAIVGKQEIEKNTISVRLNNKTNKEYTTEELIEFIISQDKSR